MPSSRKRHTRQSRRATFDLSYGALLALLGLCVAGGGSAKADVLSLLYLRPAAIAALAFFAWRCRDWMAIRPMVWLLAALAGLYAAQLVPLPPVIHGMLPGWDRLDAIQRMNGTFSDWRGVTLDPDATLNALFSLVVPAAVLVGLGAAGADGRQRLLVPVIVILLAGGCLGVLQIATGQDSPFYLYRDTYPGYAVGWFSNRNHQAAALACLFPLLRIWAERRDGPLQGRTRYAVAGGIAFLVMPLIVITGSRAGILLAVLSLVLSAIILPIRLPRSRRTLVATGALLVVIVTILASVVLLDRAASVDRLLQSGDLGSEGRVAYLATEWQIVKAFWPLGVGAGAFDPAIRMFEPDAMLHPTYFNHAHDDFLEMVVVAGLPGILVMLAGALLVVAWIIRIFRPWRTASDVVTLARAGSIMVVIVAAASTVDYSIRAPLMAALMMVAVMWMHDGLMDVRLPSGKLGDIGSRNRQ